MGMLLWGMCIALLEGCGGGDAAMPRPSTPENGKREPVLTAQSGPIPTPTDESSQINPAFLEVVRRCDAVERSPTLPVSCEIGDVDDGARMVLTMADRAAAAKFVGAAVSQIAQPFCDVANARQVPAQIVVALYDERVMRVANCLD